MTGHNHVDYRDGYRAEYNESFNGEVRVGLLSVANGEPQSSEVVYTGPDNPAARSKGRALYFLHQALCRALNAGLSPEDVASAVSGFLEFDQQCDRDGTAMVPNLQVLDVIEDSTRQVLYVDKDDQVIIVTEDEWVDFTTVGDLVSRIPGQLLEPSDATPIAKDIV